MSLLLPILALVTSWCSALGFLVLLAAGSANSSDEQLRRIKLWMLATLLVALAATGSGIWAMVAKRTLLASATGLVPALFVVAGFVYLLRTSGP